MIAVLWIALVVALIVMAVACTWMLVRRFIRLLAEVGELLVKPAILDGVHRGKPEERPVPAVLEHRSEAAARYYVRVGATQERKRQRAFARRERGLALISRNRTGLN